MVLFVEDAIRPPWIANSFRPKELEYTDKALFGKKSTEKTLIPLTGQPSELKGSRHLRSKTTPFELADGAVNGHSQKLPHRRSKSEV